MAKCDTTIGICADGAKARSELDKTKKSTQQFSSGVGKSLKNIALMAGAAGGAYLALKKLGDFLKSSVELYRAQEVAEAKLNAVLKATGIYSYEAEQAIHDLAGELQKTTGIGDELTIAAAGVLATFTQIGTETFPEVLETAANMSKLFGTDLQQSVVQLGKALNDPIVGMGALRKTGISFSETQKESIKQFMAQNDVMSAQRVMLDELNLELGGVAKAYGETAAGGADILSSAMGDLKEAMGASVAEGLDPINRALAISVSKLAATITKSRELKKVLEEFEDTGPAEGLGALEEQFDKLTESLKQNLKDQKQNIIAREVQTRGVAISEKGIAKLNRKLIEKQGIIEEGISLVQKALFYQRKADAATVAGAIEEAEIAQGKADNAAAELVFIKKIADGYAKTEEGKREELEASLAAWETSLTRMEADSSSFSQAYIEDVRAIVEAYKKQLEVVIEVEEEIVEKRTLSTLFWKDAEDSRVAASIGANLAISASTKKLAEDTRQAFEDMATIATMAYSVISSASSTSFQNQKIELDDWYNKEKEIVDQWMLDNQAAYDAKILTLDEELAAEEISEKEYADKKKLANEEFYKKQTELEEDMAEKSRALKTKQAKAEKKMAILGVIVNTALAVSKVWGQMGIAALIGQILPIAMGIAQIAIIKGQKIPKFQFGGMVGEGYGGGDKRIIAAEEGEMVIRKEAVRENRGLLEAINAGGDILLEAHIYLGTRKIYSEITRAITNKQILVNAVAITNKRVLG